MPELGRDVRVKVVEDRARLGRAGDLIVLLDERLELRGADGVGPLDVDVRVDARREVVAVALLEEVAPAARLPRAHVAPDGAEDDDDAARHVLAAVVAGALDDGLRVRVAHAEPLARAAVAEELAAGRAVQARVADDRALGRREGGVLAGDDADAAAVQALADVVVGVAAHLEVEAIEAEGAERLARAAREDKVDRALPPLVAVRLGDGAGDPRRPRAVDVADVALDDDVLVVVDGGLDVVARQQLVVERPLLRVRVRQLGRPGAVGAHVGHVLDEGEVERRRLVQRLGRVGALLQQVGAPHQLREARVAHRRHLAAHLGRRKVEEVVHVEGRADELLAQLLLLRRHADGAVVGVADARGDAADGDHRDRAEAELVGAEQRAEHHVVARLQPAVDAQHDAVAQLVEHERLVRLGEAELPRPARVLDRGERRRAGAAVVAADLDDVGVGLGDARRDGADADLPDELDRDLGGRVDLVEVVDELREVLDRVDVVVRRRRDEHDALLARADRRDVLVDLGAGQLAALARLGALRHLDLDLLGRHQVGGRHAEAARRDLLDLGERRVAVAHAAQVREGRRVPRLVGVRDGRPAQLVLTALARVGAAAGAVDADGERLVRLARQRTERHA